MALANRVSCPSALETPGWVDGWVGGGEWAGGWVNGWLGGWVGGWVDGWVGGWVESGLLEKNDDDGLGSAVERLAPKKKRRRATCGVVTAELTKKQG